MIDRRLIQNFDWGILFITLMLSAIGLMTIYSAVTPVSPTSQKVLYIKQFVWFGVGIVALVASFLVNYRVLDRWSNVLYAFCIFLLVLVFFIGKLVGGSRRWLILGPLSLQPSELAKIVVIIILSSYFAKVPNPKGLGFRELIKPVILVTIPFLLIVKQPDLGTALLIGLIAAAMTIFAKIEKRTLIYIFFGGTISIPLVWFFLKAYQKQRILTFLNPGSDPLGSGYHIIQSKIAIGSGMITGKGFLKGTQNALSFLPEQHTDFIFSVLSEEWGFIGSVMLLFLFFLLILWGLKIAHRSKDPFGTLLSIGITSMIFLQVVINIGMVTGLMPVVGVPLPLISYGGSSMITVMISIGLLMNVSMRRYMFE